VPRYLQERAIDAYASYYKIHWPGEESGAGRGLRRSPLYGVLKDAGAVFGSKFGWERANWFAGAEDGASGACGGEGADRPSFEGKPNWFDAVGREVTAIRERVAMIDQTSFAKFEVSGTGALAALDRIAANKLPEAPGAAVYTQLCNPRGGIEADLTLVHVEEGRFLVVTGAGFGVRDGHWIATHLPRDGSVAMREVTGELAVINLCGPRSREVLGAVSDADLGNEAFPFLGARYIDVGLARVLAVRIGYVGELGWELYVPQEYAAHVYETLWRAGDSHGIANGGYRAIESCRLEKGYLYWSADIGPDDTPYEAGLGFCVALDKREFIAREALAAVKANGVRRRLTTLTLDGFVPLHGGEPVRHEGRIVASLTSAGFGHWLGTTIGFAYLPVDLDAQGRLEVEAFGRSYPARRGPRTLYDAKMERLKA
jgi:4-methylaminobutanoate oxidase (formaldehyde-forming)